MYAFIYTVVIVSIFWSQLYSQCFVVMHQCFSEIDGEMTGESYENLSWSVSIQYLIHLQVVMLGFRTAEEKAMLQLRIFQSLQFAQHG